MRPNRGMVVLRHLLAIAALPFVVTVVIPVWLAGRYPAPPRETSLIPFLLLIPGLCTLLGGLFLFAHSLRRFATDGEGTLAPWDPPRKLVVRGPYRFVRNPMISGVLLILFGEAMLLYSPAHAAWALAFFAINAVVIPLVEEPQLKARFGAEYIEYCKHVPRLVPRLTPWTPSVLRPLP